MINLFYKYFLLAQKMIVWSVLCNVIRSLIWGKIAHFTCNTKGWYIFCPYWCAVVFSAQLLVFCNSFLMELGLGGAAPSISFIFLWQCVLACIQILKSWRRSAEALRDIGFHPEQKLFLFLWSCISPVNTHKDICAWGNGVTFSTSEVQLCVCVLCSSEMSLLRAAYTLQALNAIPPKASSLEEVAVRAPLSCLPRTSPLLAAAASSLCSLLPIPINYWQSAGLGMRNDWVCKFMKKLCSQSWLRSLWWAQCSSIWGALHNFFGLNWNRMSHVCYTWAFCGRNSLLSHLVGLELQCSNYVFHLFVLPLCQSRLPCGIWGCQC